MEVATVVRENGYETSGASDGGLENEKGDK